MIKKIFKFLKEKVRGLIDMAKDIIDKKLEIQEQVINRSFDMAEKTGKVMHDDIKAIIRSVVELPKTVLVWIDESPANAQIAEIIVGGLGITFWMALSVRKKQLQAHRNKLKEVGELEV